MTEQKITMESIRAKRIELEQSGVIPPDREGRIKEFQRFCEQVSKEAAARGLTEEILNEILNEEELDPVKKAMRAPGQWKGQVFMAVDFDVLPEDLQPSSYKDGDTHE